MTSSIWRKAHLILAIISSVFLVVISITGVILAGNIIINKTQYPYKVENFEELSLAKTLPVLKKIYPEITEMSIDPNHFVSIDGFDEDGNAVKAIINPNNGKILGKPLKKSPFIQEVKGIHRSLLLHEKGRFIVGIMAALLLMISLTGTIMIIKRQKGFFGFFAKIHKDSLSQFLHTSAGRWFLVPIFVVSLTGTYLFLKRFKIIPEQKEITQTYEAKHTDTQKNIADFEVFRQTKLSEVQKIEFPFSDDDPDEVFILKLKSKELEVNAFSGEITKETLYPSAVLLANLSLNLHTGRTSLWWAIVLAIATLNILVFIYTGFAITLKRKSSKVRNKFKAQDADCIILVGSENGTTLGFANKVQQQLLTSGKKVFLSYLNNYQYFPKAEHILIFTSTYGDGDAPANAEKFETLLANDIKQNPNTLFSVVGFGSRAYSNFCGFAKKIDALLSSQEWAERSIPLHLVNDKSADELVEWVKLWNEKTSTPLMTSPSFYNAKISGLKKFKVVEKTPLDEDNQTFAISLKPQFRKRAFQSGDILAVYPANDSRERLYSIGKKGNSIQLFVKLHENGLGSQYLYRLPLGQTIKAKVVENLAFHFPEDTSDVVMIANGTGTAPFLGMMSEQHPGVKKHLYCGFRFRNANTQQIEETAKSLIQKGNLHSFTVGYSRGEKPQRVTDLIREDEEFLVQILKSDGVIMICGALSMLADVEAYLTEVCQKHQLPSLERYKHNSRILSDCY